MSEEDKTKVSAGQAGSTDDLIKAGPNLNDGGVGEPAKTQEPSKKDIDLNNYVEKTQYTEAEKKIGEQGKELGDFRNFFSEVSPLLDKLQAQPELVEAILEGKVDSSLAQAVIDNKVKIEEATTITEAHKEVKDNLGAKQYEKASAADIEKMVADKVGELSKKLEDTQKGLKNDLKESENRRKFEGSIEEFVSNTTDFKEYAAQINEWLVAHPNVYDIETAYYAVKGKVLVDKKVNDEDVAKAEEAKKMAANAGGGGSQGGNFAPGVNAADQLIANSSNPNYL